MKFRTAFQFASAVSSLILLAGIAVAQTPPPPPPPAPVAAAPADVKVTTTKRGSITGRVLGEDGQPLAGVMVNVFSFANNRSTQRPIFTDEEGNFKANDLPAGAYSVSALMRGFVNAQGDMPNALLDVTQRYRLGDNVTLTMVKGGVITGKVLDGAGQPLVGAQVLATRVRDSAGHSVPAFGAGSTVSDDRGVYRLYGLQTGSYVVYTTGGFEGPSYLIGAREVPTYYPAATRDTAQEVSVTAGMEVQGIDIRHRGEPGHAVSGTIVNAPDSTSGQQLFVSVGLLHLATGTIIAGSTTSLRQGNSFALFGVPDGEYELSAQLQVLNPAARRETNGMASPPRRVTVRGGDVTGIELRLLSLSSIAGRVTLEKLNKPECQIARRGELEEILLAPRREDKEARRGVYFPFAPDTMPDEKGEFVIRDLEAGRYRLNPQLPSDHWYVKAMSLAATAPARTPSTRPAAAKAPGVAASGITLKGGETLTGLTVTIAEGAAGVIGRIVAEKDKPLPTRLRVHIVPAEKEAAEDVLRYGEVVTRDGTFAFRHLAPGQYWSLARMVPDEESEEKTAKPVAWDAAARAKLRTEAEAANNLIELTPCQRVKDYVLRFSVGK